MPEMTITPLDPLIPELTEEQEEAANQIREALFRHHGKRFKVKDFPGKVNLGRLQDSLSKYINLSKHRVVLTDREGYLEASVEDVDA